MFNLADWLFDAREPDRAIPLAREFLDRARKIEARLPAALRDAIPKAAGLVSDRNRIVGWDDRAAPSPQARQDRVSNPPNDE
jgi:hypothetical protein